MVARLVSTELNLEEPKCQIINMVIPEVGGEQYFIVFHTNKIKVLLIFLQ